MDSNASNPVKVVDLAQGAKGGADGAALTPGQLCDLRNGVMRSSVDFHRWQSNGCASWCCSLDGRHCSRPICEAGIKPSIDGTAHPLAKA